MPILGILNVARILHFSAFFFFFFAFYMCLSDSLHFVYNFNCIGVSVRGRRVNVIFMCVHVLVWCVHE